MTNDKEGGVQRADASEVERTVRRLITPFIWLLDRIVPREYVQLGVFDSYCTMTWEEALEEVKNSDDPKGWNFRVVRMTKHQFESLPEFQGW